MNKIELNSTYTQVYHHNPDVQSFQHKYMDTEMYIVKDSKLYKLVEDVIGGELYIPLNDRSLLVYQAHLDGSTIAEDEARSLYPEEFI